MSDTLETGPLTVDQAVDAMFSEPEEPTEELDVPEEEPVALEADDEAEAEPEAEEVDGEEVDEQADPGEANQEPQHLGMDDYGDLTISIVVDGVEQKVNLREAAKGYQLQRDYSRKTSALSEERKQMDVELRHRESELADKQRLLDEQLAQSIEQEPDWVKMATEDPLGYLPAKEKWNQKKLANDIATTRLRDAETVKVREFQSMTAEIAVASMPEWATDEGFTANANGRKTAALNAGFTEAEYNGSSDFRLATILEKASRYDAMQGKHSAAEKKIAKAPKVIKPTRSKGKVDVQDAKRVARKRKLSGPHSAMDAVNAFMEGRE